jgi:hypothetical protein
MGGGAFHPGSVATRGSSVPIGVIIGPERDDTTRKIKQLETLFRTLHTLLTSDSQFSELVVHPGGGVSGPQFLATCHIRTIRQGFRPSPAKRKSGLNR